MSFANYLGENLAYHKQRSHRIETLADGIFSIAMTLLVLDIRTPIRDMNTEIDIWHSLVNTLPRILTFILTFSVAGQFWSIFTNQFNYIHTSDRKENIIALLFLMFVALLPFSASFLSEHLWSRIAVGFYVFNILLILSFHVLHWYYSYHRGLVKEDGFDKAVIHRSIMIRAKIAFIAYSIVIGLCFFSSYLALTCTILVHVIFAFYTFIELLRPKRSPKARPTR